MKLTKKFLLKQGLQLADKPTKGVFVFTNEGGELFVIWDKNKNRIKLQTVTEEDYDQIKYKKIKTMSDYIVLVMKHGKRFKMSLTIPDNFTKKFLETEYEYTKDELDRTTQICTFTCLVKQEYETIPLIDKFRKDYYDKMKWKYRDIYMEAYQNYISIIDKIEDERKS